MAKGENIFRRRDGRWEARYSKGRELSGKIKYGYCYGKTYREAKEKAEKCKAALASGNPLPTSRTPNLFSAYCMGWLHAKKSKVKESTYGKGRTAGTAFKSCSVYIICAHCWSADWLMSWNTSR